MMERFEVTLTWDEKLGAYVTETCDMELYIGKDIRIDMDSVEKVTVTVEVNNG